MAKVVSYSISGQRVSTVELPDTILGRPVNERLIHEAVTNQQVNRRAGTASTKTRGKVRGGGRKPWRQKGTGRARHGSIRSPVWRGGGVVFGPKPRDFRYQMPKKVMKQALLAALSAKVKTDDLVVLEDLLLDEISTKSLVNILDNLELNDKKVLIVLGQSDPKVQRAARNIPNVKVCTSAQVNIYNLLDNEKLVLTKDALSRLLEALE